MFTPNAKFLPRWSIAHLFRLAGFFVMVLGTVVIGRWVGEKIKTDLINEVATTTALYMDSFIDPNLQELGHSNTLSPEYFAKLSNLINGTDLGRQIVSIKIWNREGQVLFSNHASLIGRTFPSADDLDAAWQGQVVSSITNLQDDENVEERNLYSRLLEIYTPVRLNGTHQIIAVAEFYTEVESLEANIAAAQRQSWYVVGVVMLVIYLVLTAFVQYAAKQIGSQEARLRNQVVQLTQLLAQNNELDERVRRAAANATAHNESLLRRTSAELHDGPVQEVSLALLRLDRVNGQNETCRVVTTEFECNDHLPTVQTALQIALAEMRSIAASIGLPPLENLTLPETFNRVVRAHEKRTRTKVSLNVADLPEQTTLLNKIAVYRLIQEALNNAYRHANGIGQQVNVTRELNHMHIEVSDKGPGFDLSHSPEWENHLGLEGMRERVESLGGEFKIDSRLNEGTKVIARLFLHNAETDADG
ncbi:MAG: sensor histidine kinase [Chloroflexi bacterium]|nr:sensor histidine kinase [Chloroflexota bacterium]